MALDCEISTVLFQESLDESASGSVQAAMRPWISGESYTSAEESQVSLRSRTRVHPSVVGVETFSFSSEFSPGSSAGAETEARARPSTNASCSSTN